MTASPDRQAELEAQLASLAERPLQEHPDVLDELHRAVVAELDELAASGRGQPPP